ncbi:MAG: hypothetical protein D6769_00385 [Methanobacteriota archaeon]|nr:MAG: hypothetical protein D6769_00385 [Euryarchaeota archaeon]
MDDGIKWIIAGLLLLVAIFLIYSVYAQPNLKELNKGEPVGSSEMNKELATRNLCIVLDLPSTKPLKQDVMNCGLEYFQTSLSTFPTKRIDFYAIDGASCQAQVSEECTSFPCKGKTIKTSPADCINKIANSGCFVIKVSEGDPLETNTYSNMLEVFLGNSTYKEGSCSIKKKA